MTRGRRLPSGRRDMGRVEWQERYDIDKQKEEPAMTLTREEETSIIADVLSKHPDASGQPTEAAERVIDALSMSQPIYRTPHPDGLATCPTCNGAGLVDAKREAPCRHCGSDWHYSDEHTSGKAR